MPGQRAQILRAVKQDVVEPDEGGRFLQHLGRHHLAPEPLLQRIEARRAATLVQRAALRLALHEQLAIHRAGLGKGRGDIGERPRHVVAGPAIEPRLTRDMDDVHANPVPFPLGGIIGEIDAQVLQRMCQHERPEHRHVGCRRLAPASLDPVEQRRIRRLDPVPHLLHRLDIDAERIRQRLLGQPRGDADAQAAGRHLEQGEPLLGVELVEHARQRRRCLAARQMHQPIHHRRHRERRRIHRAFGRRPQQRHRLRRIAHEVAAHPVQHRIDALLDQPADHRRLHPRNVEIASQRRHRPAAIGIGHHAQIIPDQLQLRQPRAGVDQRIEQLRKSVHGGCNAWRGRCAPARTPR